MKLFPNLIHLLKIILLLGLDLRLKQLWENVPQIFRNSTMKMKWYFGNNVDRKKFTYLPITFLGLELGCIFKSNMLIVCSLQFNKCVTSCISLVRVLKIVILYDKFFHRYIWYYRKNTLPLGLTFYEVPPILAPVV